MHMGGSNPYFAINDISGALGISIKEYTSTNLGWLSQSLGRKCKAAKALIKLDKEWDSAKV